MPVHVRLETTRQRVVVNVPSGTVWSSFHDAVLTAIKSQPFLTNLHWIIEDNALMNDVCLEGVASLAHTFHNDSGEFEVAAVTVVVVKDRNFGSWGHHFKPRYGGRQYIGATSVQEAQDVLDRIDGFLR